MIQSLGRDLGRDTHPGFAKNCSRNLSGCQTGKSHGGSKLAYLMGQRNGEAWGCLVEFEKRLVCVMNAAGYFFDESERVNIHFTTPPAATKNGGDGSGHQYGWWCRFRRLCFTLSFMVM